MKSPTFRWNNTEISIDIGYKNAMVDFPKMGLNLLKMFQDQSVIMTILTDDSVMLEIWWFYAKNYTSSSMEDSLDSWSPDEMEVFRNRFWDAVVNFIAPPMRPALQETKKMILQELKSPAKNLKKAYTESSEEQE